MNKRSENKSYLRQELAKVNGLIQNFSLKTNDIAQYEKLVRQYQILLHRRENFVKRLQAARDNKKLDNVDVSRVKVN
jgi:hypothetical protein